MASAEVIKKLLLKYFKEAPPATIVSHLEVMYAALTPAQKNALLGLAKDFLLPVAYEELDYYTASYNNISEKADEILAAASQALTDAQTLVDEVESL